MVSPFTTTRPTGRASFQGMLRAWDESPESIFSVELTDHLVLYGIWRSKWAPNGNDFDVEIVSFGWASKYNVGNRDPITRRKLSAEHAMEVKALVIALVNDVDASKKILPFSSTTARFLGRIEFNDNWVSLEN
jgi:hypothetical protein